MLKTDTIADPIDSSRQLWAQKYYKTSKRCFSLSGLVTSSARDSSAKWKAYIKVAFPVQ